MNRLRQSLAPQIFPALALGIIAGRSLPRPREGLMVEAILCYGKGSCTPWNGDRYIEHPAGSSRKEACHV